MASCLAGHTPVEYGAKSVAKLLSPPQIPRVRVLEMNWSYSDGNVTVWSIY